ncbi:MAG: hypothetical protein CUN52_08475 [Phototrophicales bacterium]|nr:MAG: hypothetical protein CUN52_08475 [Phototrophicales bacterium]
MDSKSRRQVTAMIWGAAFIITLLTQNMYSYGMPPSVPAFGTAILASIFLWWDVFIKAIFGNDPAQKRHPSNTTIDSKAYKLAVLLEMMDEHERQEFKYQLKNDLLSSDDSQSIESFINEKRKRGL